MKRMMKALALLMALTMLAACANVRPSDLWTPTLDAENECDQKSKELLPDGAIIHDFIVEAQELSGAVDMDGYTVLREGTPDLLVRCGTDDVSETLDGNNCYIDFLYNNKDGYIVAYQFHWKEGYGENGTPIFEENTDASSDWRTPDQVTLEDIDVTVRLSHAAIHPDSVNIGVYFENHTDRELEHGIGFTVERLESDGSWKQLRFTFDAFVWIIEPIPAGETAELVYSMTDFRQPLTEGHYRITPEDLTASAGKQVPVNSYPIPPLEFTVRTDSEIVALTDPLAAKYAAPEEPLDPEPALVPAEELLAQYPDSYQELRDRPDLVLDVHGQLVNGKLWEDFYNSVRNEIPSQVVIARLTIEGDPILYLICYDGETFHWYMDASRDTYGAEPLQSGDAMHLLLLEHNGYLWYELSNEPFETWEEYQSWTEDPQNEGKPWPVNILTLPLQE